MPPKVLLLTFDASLERERANWTRGQIRQANLGQVYEMVYNKVSARGYMGDPDDSNFMEVVKFPVSESGAQNRLTTLLTRHSQQHQLPRQRGHGGVHVRRTRSDFLLNRANVDRLRNVRTALPDNIACYGHRSKKDYDDYDILETEFTLYDENNEMVILKLKDMLDIHKLGCPYQCIPHELFQRISQSCSPCSSPINGELPMMKML